MKPLRSTLCGILFAALPSLFCACAEPVGESEPETAPTEAVTTPGGPEAGLEETVDVEPAPAALDFSPGGPVPDAALHEVKAGYEKYFWRFDRVTLANLPRADARQLIRQCAVGADVEDLRMLQTCVLQQSAGNPRAIVEIVGRLRKEAVITRSAVRDVVHTGARPRIDLTLGLIVVAMVLLAARFIARGIGSVDGYVIAGVGSAFVMGIRFFLYRYRR